MTSKLFPAQKSGNSRGRAIFAVLCAVGSSLIANSASAEWAYKKKMDEALLEMQLKGELFQINCPHTAGNPSSEAIAKIGQASLDSGKAQQAFVACKNQYREKYPKLPVQGDFESARRSLSSELDDVTAGVLRNCAEQAAFVGYGKSADAWLHSWKIEGKEDAPHTVIQGTQPKLDKEKHRWERKDFQDYDSASDPSANDDSAGRGIQRKVRKGISSKVLRYCAGKDKELNARLDGYIGANKTKFEHVKDFDKKEIESLNKSLNPEARDAAPAQEEGWGSTPAF